ncbi:MAG: N-acyl homoserine lactonase family protein [Leucobacter sp.]
MNTATRMWGLEGPTFTLPTGFLVLREEGEVTIPVPCYLIEHPRGLVLFDTGIAVEAADDPLTVFSEDELAFNHLVYETGHRPDRQIESLGFSADRVTHVVMSHVHHDHSGGMRLFPGAQFYCGVDEMPHAYWPVSTQRGLFRRQDIDAVRDFSWNEIAADFDLFGDGSVTILTLPGHTPGSVGMMVRLPTRTVLLTGDAVHLHSAVDNLMPMPSDWSAVHAVQSIRKLDLLRRTHEADLWIQHDPQDWERYGGRELR